MAQESFRFRDTSHSKSGAGGCNTRLFIISSIVLIVGLGAGILIGHFAITDSDSEGKDRNFLRLPCVCLLKLMLYAPVNNVASSSMGLFTQHMDVMASTM